MGWLRKLAFWRKRTVEMETDIDGCFTLPEAPAVGTAKPTEPT